MTKEQEQKIRQHETERSETIRHAFARWKEQAGIDEPRWIDEEGLVEELVKKWGERADYIVVGQPPAHGSRTEYEALHSALFAAQRPVLMMPALAKAAFGNIVALAWRDDKFTLHAVMDALHCVAPAAQLHVLTGYREGGSAPQIPDVLAEHGITVREHGLLIGKDAFGAQLLATAHEVNADLLVMGAFVHSMWRNMLFGGVTKYMFDHADLPILMRH